MLTPTDRHAPPATSLVPFLPAPPRLDVIEALLADLDTATTAGQRYLMSKVLTQLREAEGARQNLSGRERRMVRNTLAVLAHESERLMPNTDAFVRGARALTDALSPV
jgi:hypothetical protein